ncbi:MAG: RNA polymerase sigma factor [Kordiimonadaceae bacterium]|nr:RNA polymerase sigma factor [Kordiimonadaceae bacterium]
MTQLQPIKEGVSAGSVRALSDEEVVARVLAGDVAAFEQVMRRHNQRLFRIARSIVKNDADAEDVVQEAYIKAYLKLNQFSGKAKFVHWLTRITVNEAIQRKRQLITHAVRHSDTSYDEGADYMPSESASASVLPPERLAASAAMRRFMEAAIDDLPDEFRTVFVMRTIEQMTITETATCLGLPENTVKSRQFRATKKLQSVLDALHKEQLSESFSFDGERCDRIVAQTLSALHLLKAKG